MKQIAIDKHIHKFNDETCITSLRHLALLEQTQDRLFSFLKLSSNIYDEAILAFELKQAVIHLSQITGDILNDDILNEIFSQFCIGK